MALAATLPPLWNELRADSRAESAFSSNTGFNPCWLQLLGWLLRLTIGVLFHQSMLMLTSTSQRGQCYMTRACICVLIEAAFQWNLSLGAGHTTRFSEVGVFGVLKCPLLLLHFCLMLSCNYHLIKWAQRADSELTGRAESGASSNTGWHPPWLHLTGLLRTFISTFRASQTPDEMAGSG